MGLFKSKVVLKGGGPCDGAERVLPNDQNLILYARLYMGRDKLGSQDLIQDASCPHAYVRLDSKTFAYDGLRIVESGQDVSVEMRSFA
jgi:hypothetical protein